MRPVTILALLNLFIADVQGGLGPFLATWLAGPAGWHPEQVGFVMTLGGIAGLIFNAPAGALVDRVRRPRLWLAAGAVAIVGGSLALLPSRSFVSVLMALVAAAAGGALMAPALVALTLAVVGKQRFAHQQGRNQAWNHSGNVAAALLVAGSTMWFGAASAFYVLAGMAACSGVTLLLFRPGAIDASRGSGREPGERSQSLRSVLSNRRILLLAAMLVLFHLGNAAMLPLLGQRMAAIGHGDATRWMAICVIVAQLTMVPVAMATGWAADRIDRAWLLAIACAVLPVRAILAALAQEPYLLVPVQILDACGAGTLGVAIPILVADYTWGSGRTQTALGAVAMAQGIGAALSNSYGGVLQAEFGWAPAFLGLGVPPLLALVITLRLLGVGQAPITAVAD